MNDNEKVCREKVHELLDLVLDINSVNPRKKEITGDLPTAFFWFNGHSADIHIDVYLKGWDKGVDKDYNKIPNTYRQNELDDSIKLLKDILGGNDAGG